MRYVTVKWANDIPFIWRGKHPTLSNVEVIERAVRSRYSDNNHGSTVTYSSDVIEYRRPKDK